jgi:hypothetical protein
MSEIILLSGALVGCVLLLILYIGILVSLWQMRPRRKKN